MSLNDLPPELTKSVVSNILIGGPDPIFGHPTTDRIGRYACTSTNLQNAIERHIFAAVTLEHDDLLIFEALLAHSPRRRALLRAITFVPALPQPDGHVCHSKSSCQRANDETFAAAVKPLYAILHACDLVEGKQPLDFYLALPQPPIDETDSDLERLEADPKDWTPSPRLDL